MIQHCVCACMCVWVCADKQLECWCWEGCQGLDKCHRTLWGRPWELQWFASSDRMHSGGIDHYQHLSVIWHSHDNLGTPLLKALSLDCLCYPEIPAYPSGKAQSTHNEWLNDRDFSLKKYQVCKYLHSSVQSKFRKMKESTQERTINPKKAVACPQIVRLCPSRVLAIDVIIDIDRQPWWWWLCVCVCSAGNLSNNCL